MTPKYVKTYRKDIIKQLAKSLEILRNKKRPDQEIVIGLVLRHHPSKMEISHVLSQIQLDPSGDPNYYAMMYGDKMVRLVNKKNVYDQQIISIEKLEMGANGKYVKRALLGIAEGENARKAADKQHTSIEGGIAKEDKLRDKQRNAAKVKREAKKLERRIFQ